MEEQVKAAVADITARETVEEAVNAYMSYPKGIRRQVFTQLPHEVKKKARAASEERRGIAFRTQEGVPVFSREEFIAQAKRLTEKQRLMDSRKAVLGERVVEIKKQAQKFYGDDFLAELETALEQSA